jgi:hypothetical protein
MPDKQRLLGANSAATAMVSITIAYLHKIRSAVLPFCLSLTSLRYHVSDGKRVKVSFDRRYASSWHYAILLLITEDIHHTFEVDHLRRLNSRHGGR